jgi:peptidase A4-like protein
MRFDAKHVKVIRYCVYAALIGPLLVGPTQSFAQVAESSQSEPLRLTVTPRQHSRIAMKTMPKAVCLLHAEGDNDPAHSFKVFSDDEGTIRFHVNPSEESEEVAAFAVDCTADGKSRTFTLQLRPQTTPSADMPAPAVETRQPQEGDLVRPALTYAEALQLSDEEVLRREYPVRPDPNKAPAAFANWLRLVGQPARRVDARQAAHTELRASTPASTNNWSGFALKNAPNEVPVATYDSVEGAWYVPTVTNPIYEQMTYSVLWVGLDGDDGICPKNCPQNGHTSDLWQAGTGQQLESLPLRPVVAAANTAAVANTATKANTVNLIAIAPIAAPTYTFSTYFAWTELVPAQSITVLPNFNVSPGDEMFVEVWVGNKGANPSLSGQYAIAFVEDVSKAEYTYVYNPIGSVKVLGYQVEWIMERPFEGGVLPGLADYNNVYMYIPWAEQTDGTWLSYNQNSATQITMTDSSENVMSDAFPIDSNTIWYLWYSHN